MTIIHPIGDFLSELFPVLKGKMDDEKVVFQLVCLGWQVFIEVLHLKITLFYSIFWITKTIQLIVK